MINSKVDHCTTLSQFYKEIRSQQEAAHGHDYCKQHDAIVRYMKFCDSYKELGTHQGGTAAAACLTNPKRVELIDISMEKFNVSRHLFESYCEENNIELVVKEMDSTSPKGFSRTDLLLIDSYHKAHHLAKELEAHADGVSKYIIMHDTCKPTDELYQYLVRFTSGISPWRIVEHCTDNVGYTVLGKNI